MESEQRHEHPALAEGGELGVVGLLGVHGTRVELEIAGVDDGAHRRLDGEPDAVGDGVGDADGEDDEAARPDLVSGLVGTEIRALEHALLLQAVARDGQVSGVPYTGTSNSRRR